MDNYRKHLIEINLAVLVISSSGVLGKYIDLPPAFSIWARSTIACIAIGLYAYFKGFSFRVNSTKDARRLVISSLLLGVHWVTYFYSLQLSNVAIGLLSLYTFPIFTALLAPLFLDVKLEKKHLLLSALLLIGVYFITPEFNFESNHFKGVLFGLLSALLYALRNIYIKREAHKYEPPVLMFYQLVFIVLFFVPTLVYCDLGNLQEYVPYLLLLGLLTTAVGHTLFVNSLKYLHINTASILSSVQPIYAIILAAIFLHEIPQWTTLIGGLFILSSVLIESLSVTKK